jgi:hypothetical protein
MPVGMPVVRKSARARKGNRRRRRDGRTCVRIPWFGLMSSVTFLDDVLGDGPDLPAAGPIGLRV